MTTVLVTARQLAGHGDPFRAVAPGARLLAMDPDGTIRDDHVEVAWADADVEVAFGSTDLFERLDDDDAALRRFFGCVVGAGGLQWFHVAAAGVDAPVFGALLERGVRLTRHTGPMSTDPGHVERPSEDELRERLTPLQFEVTQNAGTERAFTGIYNDEKRPGTYRCIVCGLELFESDAKYDSGSGWPSFWKPIAEDRVHLEEDRSHGMVRTEVTCARCDAHLGHLFPDGPQPTGQRYCMNSASLDLEASEA